MKLADAIYISHFASCHCNAADRLKAEFAQKVRCIKFQIFQAVVELGLEGEGEGEGGREGASEREKTITMKRRDA